MERVHFFTGKEDTAGVLLSVVCLVHCAVFAFGAVLSSMSFPILGHSASDEHTHVWFAGAVLAISLLAFGRGFCLHKRVDVLLWAAVGLALVLFALTFEEHNPLLSTALTVCGSIVLLASHLKNRRYGNISCQSCAKNH